MRFEQDQYPDKHTPDNHQRWKPFSLFFFWKNASGQPVVQEVDPISTPLEETNWPNGPEVTSDNISTFRTTRVSEFKAILLLMYFERRIQTFKAGSLAPYSHICREMTSDPEVLEC